MATNSFWFGVAAGVGLKWGTLGLEHLGKANAVTQHYAGLLIGVEATSRTDEPPAQPAALPPEASDQEPLPGA
ncbi:MAG TPA: hypothetical protein VK712_00015 [Verrucomicrobiae bacterium]|nr:hypothetical protein [Verrucomicrobiae bacterium]